MANKEVELVWDTKLRLYTAVDDTGRTFEALFRARTLNLDKFVEHRYRDAVHVSLPSRDLPESGYLYIVELGKEVVLVETSGGSGHIRSIRQLADSDVPQRSREELIQGIGVALDRGKSTTEIVADLPLITRFVLPMDSEAFRWFSVGLNGDLLTHWPSLLTKGIPCEPS